MQSYSIAWYEAAGQAKMVKEFVPGIDNGYQQQQPFK
jgi:hypothetical protein